MSTRQGIIKGIRTANTLGMGKTRDKKACFTIAILSRSEHKLGVSNV